MATTGGRLRRAGEWCWFNIITPEPKAAQQFFAKVLGWTYQEVPRGPAMMTLLHAGGKQIGAMHDMGSHPLPSGVPPHMGGMVRVVDCDAKATLAEKLGGKVVRQPFDIGPNGRMAVLADPNGAVFDVWQPNEQGGTEVDEMTIGAPSWYETMTTDVDRAAKFYADLFEWEPEASKTGMPGYVIFKHGKDDYVAGMMRMTPEMGQMPPHWGVYFTVKSADEAAKAATAGGGKVVVPPHDIPGQGRFCGLVSPQGVMFYAINYTK